jgi:hypothetical protein
MDYIKLRDLLAEGKFEAADDETRALLIQLAGPGAVDRKWVYFTEVYVLSFMGLMHACTLPACALPCLPTLHGTMQAYKGLTRCGYPSCR